MRTVYLGTSDFAAAVLERLAGQRAPAGARGHAPGRARRPGPQARAAAGRADGAQSWGWTSCSPRTCTRPRCSTRIAAARPTPSCVCAFGVLIREPLLSDYELLNVHPSLLPRWRGAAPVERAIMAGDAETGVSIMRLTAGLDSGPVCLQDADPDRPRRRLRDARRRACRR